MRARLATGALPPAEPTKVWGGTSTGSTCLGCTGAILAGQIEYEVQFANAVVFRLHRACYLIWDGERRTTRREISGGAGSSWALLFDHGLAQRAGSERWVFDALLDAAAEAMLSAVRVRARSRILEAVSASLCTRYAATTS